MQRLGMHLYQWNAGWGLCWFAVLDKLCHFATKCTAQAATLTWDPNEDKKQENKREQRSCLRCSRASYPLRYFARLLLVRHRVQSLATSVAANQGNDARSLRTNHTVIERAIRLGTSLRADGSCGGVVLVRNRTAGARLR
jgi:hypothetical protein